MSGLLHVSSSPHIRSKVTTSNIMLMVFFALLPTSVFGVFNFGIKALLIIIISIATCILTEYVYEKLMHKKVTITDMSAVVTGLLLALNLPYTVPLWIPIIGGVFSILIVKQLFGGLGQNFMNPALAGRCFLLISFTARMTDFGLPDNAVTTIVDAVSSISADAVTGATPLAILKSGKSVDLWSMFIGNTRGTIGETSAIAIIIGAIFLLCIKVIHLRIPLTYIGSFVIFITVFGGHGLDLEFVAAHLLGGGLMLGAFFMATDYVTSPITKKGQVVYGICLGLLTGLFRLFGAGAEGVSYAIIFGNLLVPLIERVTLPTAFGLGGKKHEVNH